MPATRGAWRAVAPAIAALAAACSPADAPIVEGPAVALSVAPLDLPGLTDAAYRITVRNGTGAGAEIVWQRELDSLGYGDGSGNVSYVGPCDASTGVNAVELEVVRLTAGGADLVPGVDYSDPTASGPLVRAFDCVEDRDTSVAFDLTIARQAQQGFFDVAVSFDDVFCSAKLDCQDENGGDITLLHGPSGRGRTVVLGFACTARLPGQDGATTLYLDDVVLTCADTTVTVDPSKGPGNLVAGDGYTETGAGTLFAAAVYRGEEQLGFNKAYWNVALGIADPAAASCQLTTTGTATDGVLIGNQTPAGAIYPYVSWDVPLTDASGNLTCTRHRLGDGTGVAIAYTDGVTARGFAHLLLTAPAPTGVWDAATWDTSLWAP